MANNHFINTKMLRDQKCSVVDILNLHELHDQKDDIFERAKAGENMGVLLRELRKVEFAMQDAWHYERDETKHSWKYLIPNSPIRKRILEGSWAEFYLHGTLGVRFRG